MDISLCNNSVCNAKTKCLRFMGKPEPVQGYITPRTKEKCNLFILNNTKNRTIYTNTIRK